MGIEEGAVKYMIFTPLTAVGFVCMLIFGGTIITLVKTLGHLFSGNPIQAFLEYFIYSLLPPTSIGQVLFLVFIGTLVAGIKWFIVMWIRENAF